MSFTFGQGEDRNIKARLRTAFYIATAIFLLLGGRLWYLQVFKGQQYRKESEENSVRVKKVSAPRGIIRDRFGKLIIDNKPNYIASIVPEDVRNLPEIAAFLHEVLGIEPDDVINRVRRNTHPRYLPVRIKRSLSWGEVARIEARRYEFPGLEIEVDSRRSYIYGDIAPHLLGYLSEINPKELEEFNKDLLENRYSQGDQVGKSGIERRYQHYLRGRGGFKTVRVDSAGREIAEISRVNPEPGNNLHLTLDLDLQLYARELFEGKAGVLLALDPRNGEILAVINGPGYDPEDFSGGISHANWTRLREDPKNPLINRAIRGLYPPGSVYKVIPAAAALEHNIVTEKTKINCTGFFKFGNRTFRCWKKGGHGLVDVLEAMKQSCDVFFYTVGDRLGVDRLADFASHLGMGRPTGIDVEGEAGGIVPSTQWKRQRYNQPWFPGETISVSIGQGYNLVTPLQVASMFGAVGIGGKVYRPHLLRMVTNERGHVVNQYEPVLHDEMTLSPRTTQMLRRSLAAVLEPGGTAWSSRLPFKEIKMAGKTGTAQVVGYKGDARSAESAEHEDHAWFVGFAPVDNPEIVAVALVEHGGSGSKTAAPLVRALVQRYFELKAEREGVSVDEIALRSSGATHTGSR
jgi:penicillin-binding protein 2